MWSLTGSMHRRKSIGSGSKWGTLPTPSKLPVLFAEADPKQATGPRQAEIRRYRLVSDTKPSMAGQSV